MSQTGIELVELSEMVLLGSIFLNTAIWPDVKPKLVPGSFRSERNGIIFEGLLDLDARGGITRNAEPLNVFELALELHKKNHLSPEVKNYLFDIVDNTATSAAWEYHLGVVIEDAMKREIASLTELVRQGVDTQGVAAQIKERIERLQESLVTINPQSMRQSVVQAVKEIEAVSKIDGAVTGLSTGLVEIDRRTSGWQDGNLVIVAGRPGMGKSILLKDFAVAAKVPVSIFSLEMDHTEITKRQLATTGNIPFSMVQSGRLRESDWERLVDAANVLSDLPVTFHDCAKVTTGEIEAILAKDIADYGTRLCIIDYLQLISPSVNEKNREQEVSKISRELKLMAKELHIPVIVAAQLNRSCEMRGKNKRPILSDLRESGSIEQDADIVIFIYRDSFYYENSNPHIAELKIAKGRNIRVGTVQVFYSGEYQCFRDLTEDDNGTEVL